MSRKLSVESTAKALLLIGLGLFLFSRIVNGTIYYYINQRFTGLTLLAVFGCMLVGISFLFWQDADDYATTFQDNHGCDGPPAPRNPGHHGHSHHEHDHALTWGAAFIILVPILLGLFISPRPLGASAMANREVGFESRQSAMPAAVAVAASKTSTERNILDWIYAFQKEGEPSFAGAEADVTGFVFRNEKFAGNEFSLTRYIVSCCVADASYVSIVTRGSAAEKYNNDEWVRVRGYFEMGTFDGSPRIILIPREIVTVPIPNQPYLYP